MTKGWLERDEASVWHGFTQMAAYTQSESVIVERAEGHEVIDVDGRRYLDAISSLWVTTLGHRVEELDAALVAQLDRVAHSTLLGNGSRIVIELAEALARVVPVPGPHFLFGSDGATAVEQALKVALQYWQNRGVSGRSGYLALGDAYHGDTVGALSLGADGFGAEAFNPLRFPIVRAPGYRDPEWVIRASELIDNRGDELAAVVIEPLVQCAAGMIIADPGEFSVLQDACARNDVLLICDEVATGFGRTGSLFASEQCGLGPDLLCLGKGMTGGYLPMSVTVASDRVFSAFLGEDLGPRTFYHGHSYGGNALAAAVAVRHLELLEEWDVLENVQARSRDLGDLLSSRIAPLDQVAEVRLFGLLCGIELHSGALNERRGRRVCKEAVRRGVLLRPIGDVVIVVPPLTITRGELERIVDVLGDAIEEVVPAAQREVASR